LAVGQRRHMVMCVTSCVFFRGPPSGGLPLTMDLFRFFRTARAKCQVKSRIFVVCHFI